MNKAKLTQKMFIIQSAFEYLISILVAGTYLATLTGYLGLSDGVTGVLSSIISLGSLFQIFTIFISVKRVKPFVIFMGIANQVLFMLLYVIPIINISSAVKNICFVVTIVLAYLIYNVSHPKKINWLMGMVENHNRGKFSGVREMVSLACGIVFNLVMGNVVDRYKAEGNMHTAFIVCAITILIGCVLHTLSLVFAAETKRPVPEHKEGMFKNLFGVIKDKTVLSISLLFVLFQTATHFVNPFMNTYRLNELGLSISYIAVITMIGSISRIAVTPFMGTLADKIGFAKMLRICLCIEGAGFFINIFNNPSNGHIFSIFHLVLNGCAQAGINSCLINLVFDYVPLQKRENSLAVTQALSGVSGFLVTLLVSPFLTYLQSAKASGNYFLGINAYAQQILSSISCIILVVLIAYISFYIIPKLKKQN